MQDVCLQNIGWHRVKYWRGHVLESLMVKEKVVIQYSHQFKNTKKKKMYPDREKKRGKETEK